VESLVAQEQQARFALAATHITLSSNVLGKSDSTFNRVNE
jgi:hypothetical protein